MTRLEKISRPLAASFLLAPVSVSVSVSASALLLGSMCLLPTHAQAQKPSASQAVPAPAASKVDFAKGFALLQRAGLPDLKDWKYVKFESDTLSHDERWREELEVSELSGKGWVEAKPDASGLRRLTFDGLTMIAITEEEDEATVSRLDGLARRQGLEFHTGTITPADEAADAALLAIALARAAQDADDRDWLKDSHEQLVVLLFTAGQLHHRGLTQEANDMAGVLLRLAPRQDAFIELAVGTLADERLRLCLVNFSQGHNWKALHTSLEALLQDFPKGWRIRPVAERLLVQVKARANGQPAPAVNPGPFTLTDEQKAWWQKVADFRPAPGQEGAGAAFDGSRIGSQWLASRTGLPDSSDGQSSSSGLPWNHFGSRGHAGAQKETLATLTAKGGLFDLDNDWDWLVVMAAGVGDQTRTTLTSGGRSLRPEDLFGDVFGSAQDAQELTPEQEERIWQKLNRPLTRDEIARAFLGSVLPITEGSGSPSELHRMDAGELQEAARAWSARVSGKQDRELVRVYLKDGTPRHLHILVHKLVARGEEADFALVEEAALDQPVKRMDAALEVLRKRRTAGKPFLEKFKARYLAVAEEQDTTGEKDAQRRQAMSEREIRRVFSVLDGLVSENGIADSLKEYGAGRMDRDSLTALVMTVGDDYAWTRQEIEALFAAAAQAPPTEWMRRYVLMELAGHAVYGWMEENAAPPTPDATATPDTPPPDWMRQLFREAVQQHQQVYIPDTEEQDDATLGQRVAYMLDSLWNETEAVEARSAVEELPGEDRWAYLASRGMARLNGQPVPPIPDATQVPEARQKQIKAALKKPQLGGAWSKFTASLDIHEKLVLQEALLAEEELSPSWRKSALLITDLVLSGAAATSPPPWKALEGRSLDAKLLKTLLQQVQATLKDAGKDVQGTLLPRGFMRGQRILVADSTLASEPSEHDLSVWLHEERDEDGAKLEVTAISFVGWGSAQQSGGAMAFLLGKDGKWSPMSDEEPPIGFAELPFSELQSPEDFIEEFQNALETHDLNADPIRVEFGAVRIPAEPVVR